jgi:hypothetical protein
MATNTSGSMQAPNPAAEKSFSASTHAPNPAPTKKSTTSAPATTALSPEDLAAQLTAALGDVYFFLVKCDTTDF